MTEFVPKPDIKFKFEVIEWFDAVDGGLWETISFWDTFEQAGDSLRFRHKGSKNKIKKVEIYYESNVKSDESDV